jgi:translation initiation factor IF-3
VDVSEAQSTAKRFLGQDSSVALMKRIAGREAFRENAGMAVLEQMVNKFTLSAVLF